MSLHRYISEIDGFVDEIRESFDEDQLKALYDALLGQSFEEHFAEYSERFVDGAAGYVKKTPAARRKWEKAQGGDVRGLLLLRLYALWHLQLARHVLQLADKMPTPSGTYRSMAEHAGILYHALGTKVEPWPLGGESPFAEEAAQA